jgi:diguanylate cyclase (GGDEF)-like protein/PAS domain S-box-containing protein
MIATLVGWFLIRNIEQRQIKQNIFDYRVERIKNAIDSRIMAYQQILHSGIGLFVASDSVTRQEWHQFVSNLQINQHYPGIQGVGFSIAIQPQEKETHIKSIQSEGGFFQNYTIKPSGEREQYTSIIYLEPLDKRNQQAIGYDMFSEPTRREAMERARDTGKAALSGRVTLVQEIDEDVQAGFLIYVPLYRRGFPLNTVEEKRAALLGFVYSPFRMSDFMYGIFGKQPSGIDLHIYDGKKTANNLSATDLMYDELPDFPENNDSAHNYQALFSEIETIEIAGHFWTLQFRSIPQFESSTKTYTSKVVLLGGIVVGFLLFGLTRSFETARLFEAEHDLNLKLQTEIKERKQIEIELKALNRDFITMLDNTSDFIYFKDRESRIHFCSQTLAKITGHRHWKEMKGKHDFEIFPKDIAQIYYEEELPIFSGEKTSIDTVVPYYNTRKELCWVHTNKWAVFDDNNEIMGVFGISRDITERKRMEIELTESKKLSDNIINSLPGIFYMLDEEGKFVRWNPHFNQITGYSNSKIMGKLALDIIAKEDKELVATRIKEVFEKGEGFVEAALLNKNGEKIAYFFTGRRITLQEKNYIVGLGQDITERKQMEQQLWTLANTDFLTGLMSRRYFMQKIEDEFAHLRNHEMPYCSILMLDLDHFKHINDTYGHAVGDTVLKHFSALLQSNLRQMDVAGRLGGEEFAIILPYVDANEAKKCAERLRNIIETTPIIENDKTISITVSIGISTFKENDPFADTALIRADNALFAAKNSGRNSIQIAA